MAVDFSKVFGTKDVPKATQEELEARASRKFQYGMSGAKPWAHIMSMASTAAMPITTYSKFEEAYPSANRPKITIDNIDVKSHGEYGTLRRASVKLKVFSDAAMDELANSYFVPQMSIRIQFGWSVNASGAVHKEIYTAIATDSAANIEILARSNSNASYDGFQGRMISWDFSLDDNLAWNVTFDIIGAASSVQDVKVNDETNPCYCEQKSPPAPGDSGEEQEEKEDAKTKTSDYQSALIQLIDNASNRGTIGSKLGIYLDVVKLKFNGYERDQAGTEDTSSPWYTFGMGDPSVGTSEAFISFGSLCKLISRTSGQTWCEGNPCLVEVDVDGVQVSNYGFSLFSCDPRVCVLQGSPYSLTSEFGDNKSYNGLLGNIYINCIHALRLAKDMRDNSDSIMDYLQVLLKDINNACGNGWEFDVIDVASITESKSASHLMVVDLNLTPTGGGELVLKSKADGSNIRAVELSMKMTDAMKTQALYSDASTVPADTTSCADRFLLYASGVTNQGAPKNGDAKPSACGSDKCSKTQEAKDDPIAALVAEVNDKHVASAKSYVTEQRSQKSSDQCKAPIMPFSFSVTLTGIGGFGFGQLVQLDRMPQRMKEKIKYQITSVEHSITSDDWTTKVNTIGRNRT
tara:strand:+ start:6489 stop:8387 length:1899 start_codon:yes stop_codon:yes gene_type:complete